MTEEPIMLSNEEKSQITVRRGLFALIARLLKNREKNLDGYQAIGQVKPPTCTPDVGTTAVIPAAVLLSPKHSGQRIEEEA